MKKVIKLGLIVVITIIITICVMLIIFNLNKDNKDVITNKGKISILDIELRYTDLNIKIGEQFKVETNNEYISIIEEEDKIYIKEKKHSVLSEGSDADITIYIPKNVFRRVDLEAGSGQVYIESLETNTLEFEFSAGITKIENLIVHNEASIDGGSGNININNGKINNLDLELGVGKFVLNSDLTGKSSIDGAVGSLEINLNRNLRDYTIEFEKGLGVATINGETLKAGFSGKGKHKLEIEGGVGKIEISTKG